MTILDTRTPRLRFLATKQPLTQELNMIQLFARHRRAMVLLLLTLVFAGLAMAQAAPPADMDKRLADLEKATKSAQMSGDNAWMLTSSALVLMMTGPGLALFYGGLVRRKNVLGTMMRS